MNKRINEFFKYSPRPQLAGPVANRYEHRKHCPQCGNVRFRTSVEVGPATLKDCEDWPKYVPELSMNEEFWMILFLRKWFLTDWFKSVWYKCLLKVECVACIRSNPEGAHTQLIHYARPMNLYRNMILRIKNSKRFAPVLTLYRRFKRRLVEMRIAPVRAITHELLVIGNGAATQAPRFIPN